MAKFICILFFMFFIIENAFSETVFDKSVRELNESLDRICMGQLELVKSSWKKSGFNAVALITVKIKNLHKKSCKDITGNISFYSRSNMWLGTTPFTIYNSIPPGVTRTFSDINVGFLPPPIDQVATAKIEIVGGDAYDDVIKKTAKVKKDVNLNKLNYPKDYPKSIPPGFTKAIKYKYRVVENINNDSFTIYDADRIEILPTGAVMMFPPVFCQEYHDEALFDSSWTRKWVKRTINVEMETFRLPRAYISILHK